MADAAFREYIERAALAMVNTLPGPSGQFKSLM
jgi:hypothetical protein